MPSHDHEVYASARALLPLADKAGSSKVESADVPYTQGVQAPVERECRAVRVEVLAPPTSKSYGEPDSCSASRSLRSP